MSEAELSEVEAAAASAEPPGEWVLDLLADTGLNVGAHLDRPDLAEDHLAWLASHDRHCAGSDGIYQGQHPHPRGHGSFARLARQYLADGSEAGYQRIAKHLAANAADTYGLSTRGRLAPGNAADICVLSPYGLADRATYSQPTQQATGLAQVIVNGATVWRDGKPVTISRPGDLVSR